MRLYEVVLVLRPSLAESERKKIISTVKEWLKDLKVTNEEDWGQKPLAYRIKREIAGFYHMMQLEGEKGIEPGFEKRLLANDGVLRHLVLRKK
jgi:small subunit ribosomal protein S6